jgi:hypothetical protein
MFAILELWNPLIVIFSFLFHLQAPELVPRAHFDPINFQYFCQVKN